MRLLPACPGRAERAGGRGGGELAFQLGELGVDLAGLGGLVELGLDRVRAPGEVGECARGEELVDGPGPGLHLGDLVLGPLHRHAGVAHRLGDARDGLADLGLGLGGGVARLQRLFLGAERLDARLELLGRLDELVLLRDELVVLGLQPFELGRDRGPPGERLAGEVLAVLAEGRACLILQLVGARLELLGLELDPLAGGRDVGDAPAHLLELLELLLVGEIERLAGVLDAVEDLVRLRLHDAAQAFHHAHRSLPPRRTGQFGADP